jgi:hypothetical protein
MGSLDWLRRPRGLWSCLCGRLGIKHAALYLCEPDRLCLYRAVLFVHGLQEAVNPRLGTLQTGGKVGIMMAQGVGADTLVMGGHGVGVCLGMPSGRGGRGIGVKHDVYAVGGVHGAQLAGVNAALYRASGDPEDAGGLGPVDGGHGWAV